MRLRIGFITDRVYPFYSGGYETSIYNVAMKLAKYFDITVFTSLDSRVREINNVKYLRVAPRRKYVNSKNVHNLKDAILFYLNLKFSIKLLNQCDLLFVNTIPYLGYGSVIRTLKKRTSIRIVSIFHEAWFDYLKTMSPITRKILRHEIESIVTGSDFIIARSGTTYESLVKNYYAKNVYIVPDGIDPKSIDEIKGDTKDRYDIIFVGRLSVIKHVEDIVYATSMVVRSFPNLRVIIVGDGELKNMLHNLIKEKHLEQNIFMAGYVSDTKKYKLLKSSKMFIMPSEREGFSISALEAMYCGCVPVVSQPIFPEVFGASDFVKDGKTGLFFKLHNINDLSSKIEILLKDHDLYKSLQEEGIKVSSLYSWENSTDLLKNLISGVFFHEDSQIM